MDQSPYGIWDMGGSRQEWTKDIAPSPSADTPAHLRTWRGGAWSVELEDEFRTARRGYSNAGYVGGRRGFRLVLRPRLVNLL